MGLKEYLWKNFRAKTIQIMIPEPHCYPIEPDFIFPSLEFQMGLIEEYAKKQEKTVTFLSTQDPIVFRLGERDIYEAKAVLGWQKYAQGYSLHCYQKRPEEVGR